MLLSEIIFDGNNEKRLATQDSHILYRVNFEENDPFPSFLNKQVSTPYGIQLVEKPVYEGKWAARFELRDGDPENNNGTRAEIALPAPENKNNPERWYAFAVYFPREDYDVDNKDEVISQWHQGGKATPSLCIRTKADRVRLRIVTQSQGKEWEDMGMIKRDVWQYYVIHVRHSAGFDGLIEIWRDGEQLIRHVGPNMYDTGSGKFHAPNWKLGVYKSSWNGASVTKASKRVLYFDDIKIGDEHASFSDLEE